MRSSLKLAALAAAAACIAVTAAQADELPVTNLTFTQGVNQANLKELFSSANPTGWSRGPGGRNGDLTCIGGPGQVTGSGNGCYHIHPGLGDPPPGGNFVEADGNPDYFSVFQQNVTVDAGVTYTLSFWEAAGQQLEFTGDTTEQWRVILGGTGISLTPSSNSCTATPTIGNNVGVTQTFHNCYSLNLNGGIEDTADEPIMGNLSGGVVDWNEVNLTFTAPGSGGAPETELLQFLAWGNGGSNDNLPPTLFLAGVNTPARNAPEPLTLSIFGAGAAGVWLRRRAKRKTQA